MHPLCGALPVPYVPVRVTLGAVIPHRFTYAPPRRRTTQYRRTFIPLSVSQWNNLSDPVFDGLGLAGFKSMLLKPASPIPSNTGSLRSFHRDTEILAKAFLLA